MRALPPCGRGGGRRRTVRVWAGAAVWVRVRAGAASMWARRRVTPRVPLNCSSSSDRKARWSPSSSTAPYSLQPPPPPPPPRSAPPFFFAARRRPRAPSVSPPERRRGVGGAAEAPVGHPSLWGWTDLSPPPLSDLSPDPRDPARPRRPAQPRAANPPALRF